MKIRKISWFYISCFVLFASIFLIQNQGFSQIFTVINTNDAGAGSLRQAITDANAYAGSNPQIVFDIPFPATNTEGDWSWWTITLSSSLPAITKAGTQILGFTQSTNRGITDGVLVGTGGTVGVDLIPLPKFERPTICINANDKSGPVSMSAASVLIEGFSIYNSMENTIYVTGNAAGTIVRKIFMGVLPTGLRPVADADRNNRFGIDVSTNNGNLVTVSHCYCGHNGRIAINGESATSNVLAEYNEIFDNNWYGANAWDGIDVNGLNSTVRYNLVYNTHSGSNVPPTATNSGGAGIEGGSTTPSKESRYLIENNTCYNNDGPGINIINGCTKNIIRKNICYGNEVGVSVTTRTGTDPATAFITHNSLYNNRSVGIDINHTRTSTSYDGVTTNEELSQGTAPYGNNRQTFPVVASAYNLDDKLHIEGTLHSVANTHHQLDFYVNESKDLVQGVESEYGEGKTYLLSFEVITDGLGVADFSYESASSGPVNYYLSATASNLTDSVTSEFSQVAQIADHGYSIPLENFYPASGYGTLGFEDLWPGTGDYDFNDMVINYQFKVTTDHSDKVQQVDGTFILKATGASLRNGFGFQLPAAINAADLTVTGSRIKESYITLSGNGTESGLAIPTIIVFDNAQKELRHPGVGIGVNTDKTAPYVTPVTIQISIAFPAGVYSSSDLDISNFNPFIMVDLDRSVEVHLPDYPPTTKADPALFGTHNDASIPGEGKYYRTANGMPWAMNIPEEIPWAIEKTPVNEAYLHFVEWATSSDGNTFPDWYQNKPGYRNAAKIY